MAMEQSLSIKVPKGMLDRIDREVELGEYSSRSDFVKTAIRIHLQQLQTSRENATAGGGKAGNGGGGQQS